MHMQQVTITNEFAKWALLANVLCLFCLQIRKGKSSFSVITSVVSLQRYHLSGVTFSGVTSVVSFVHSSTYHQRSFLVHISPHFHCFILSDLHTFTHLSCCKTCTNSPSPTRPLRGTPKFEYEVLSQQKLLAPSIKISEAAAKRSLQRFQNINHLITPGVPQHLSFSLHVCIKKRIGGKG
ncbi:hypothetical protein POVCU2_0032200 [Plasmodium ovale curtisi]|uniref:Uncharacterized protein n=1 Tax=Plasmodium ovale curtisi TaxID=864141 RepID=A0A1A8WSZ0_PLAOA|nr:hypothetical protein POVCU2_0032200 [Plasmodium ovale curtisi]SBS95431.1 hypothetical protein POVCU1_029620 [Plasmodium ovale curtisi]